MIAYLTKSDASKGFNQIIDFLNGNSIKYALTVNLNNYVSCIKQFWTSVVVKKVNDVIRLQALVDKKRVVITEASIRDALRLDDAEGIECLPNKEIFTELARMGYEKPSTKLTFYKAFFSSQWKFLIHTILQCMSAKRTSWNEFSSSMASDVICLSSGRKFNFSKYIFDSLVRNVDIPTKFYMYPRFLQLMIRKQVGDLSSHSTKYTSPVLTQKVAEGDDDEVHVEDVNDVGVATEGVVSAAEDIPSTSQVQLTPHQSPQVQPQSPQHQPQPSQDAGLPINLLQNLMDTSTTLTRRVEHLEQDKIAQALEITMLKSKVNKLERRNKASKLERLKKVGSAQRIDTSDDTVIDDDVAVDAKDGQDADIDESADIQGRTAVSQAQIYQIDLEHANKIITEVVTTASTTITAADVPILAATTAAAPILTATPSRRRKGVVIRDPEESTTTSTIIHSEAKSKHKGKGILVEEPKPLKKKQKEDNAVKRYQALKRKPQTEAQARKNMMLYLKNVAGFKMDYFKGMTYDDIRLIFEKHFDSNVAFLQKTKEQMDEEDSRALKRLNESQEEKAAKKQKLDEGVEELKRHLQIVPNDEDDVYTEATPLARKVPIVDYEIYNENNKPYYKIKRADGSHQLYLSFLSLLRNFDREDLEALWSLVEERFATTKPKNFFDDFMLITLGAISQELEAVGILWCADNHIYNNTVDFAEEESEVSLELLRFIRQQHQEGVKGPTAYVSGESSSGQDNKQEQGPSTLGNQVQVDDYDFWTESYASDDDEIPTKQVSQDIMEEVSLTIDEAKLKKIDDEMLRQRFLSCQRDPEAPALSLINQDLLYLKKGSSDPEKIVLSLHKFLAVIFNDDDIKERTSRWIFYISKQKEPGKPKEVIYSSSNITQVIKTYWELGHEHKFITEIVARRANECIVSITEPDFKNLSKNDIEDMYLLIMNGTIPDYAETGLLWSLSVFIRRIEKHEMFSIIYESVHGIIYKNSKKEKRVMRHLQIHKFCDATLNRVLERLKSYNNDVKYGYIQKDLTKDEAEYLKLFEEEIEVRLKYRRQMRRWDVCEWKTTWTTKRTPRKIDP
nr:hypothetical protein [Tanacetum cinerariifolium]